MLFGVFFCTSERSFIFPLQFYFPSLNHILLVFCEILTDKVLYEKMSFFVSGMHCAYNSHGLNFGVGFVEMSFFIATLFLRLSCNNGMENIRNRASPAPVKLQLVPTHLLEGRIKIKPRPHQEDPAPSLIHQCPHNLGLSYLNCSSDQGDPNPILGSCPRAKGRLLPL